MRKFLIMIFYFGFIFYGGGFLIDTFQCFAYNGFGDIFKYVKPENLEINAVMDPSGRYQTFVYTYIVNGKKYESKQKMLKDNISKNEFYEYNMVYNEVFPSFTYIGKKDPRVRETKGGMIIWGSIFIFIFLIYKFADLDKWIGVYTRGEYKSSKK